MAGLAGSISAALQIELDQLFQTAKHKHLESIQALESRMASEVAAYRADVAKLRQERDDAVEARMSAQLAAQKAAQHHALERHELESQIKSLNDKLSQARQEADIHAKEVQHLRKQAEQTAGALEKLHNTDEKLQQLQEFIKWSYDLAVTEGRASFPEEDDGAPPAPIPTSISAPSQVPVGTFHISARMSPPPPAARILSPAPQPHASSSSSTRIRGTPAPQARTVSAVFELRGTPRIKEEETDPAPPAPAPAPTKRKRPTHPPTPRQTHEPTTPQTLTDSGAGASSSRRAAFGDEDISEDEMMLRPAAVSTSSASRRVHVGSSNASSSGGRRGRARSHSRSRRRRDQDEYEDEYAEEEEDAVDDDPPPPLGHADRRDRGRARGRERSASPKRRKTAGTPFPKKGKR